MLYKLMIGKEIGQPFKPFDGKANDSSKFKNLALPISYIQ